MLSGKQILFPQQCFLVCPGLPSQHSGKRFVFSSARKETEVPGGNLQLLAERCGDPALVAELINKKKTNLSVRGDSAEPRLEDEALLLALEQLSSEDGRLKGQKFENNVVDSSIDSTHAFQFLQNWLILKFFI